MPKDQAKIDAAHKKWQAVSGHAQADVKTQSKRKKGSVPDTKKQEEVKTKSGDDVAPPSTTPEGDSIAPAGMHTVMVNKAQDNSVLSQFQRNFESSEMTELMEHDLQLEIEICHSTFECCREAHILSINSLAKSRVDDLYKNDWAHLLLVWSSSKAHLFIVFCHRQTSSHSG